MKSILEGQWSREKICDEEETVKEFTYLGDRVSTGGGFEAAATARTRHGLVKPR